MCLVAHFPGESEFAIGLECPAIEGDAVLTAPEVTADVKRASTVYSHLSGKVSSDVPHCAHSPSALAVDQDRVEHLGRREMTPIRLEVVLRSQTWRTRSLIVDPRGESPKFKSARVAGTADGLTGLSP
jgi:hypothetical protein